MDIIIDKNILTKNAKSKIILEYTDIEKIKDKNILLVDDTCFTGKTLNTTKQHLYDLGAKTVKTYCLYNCPKGDFNSVDYHSGILDRIPLYWPWGYELN